ncbi:MAG: hypothetical protein IJ274_07265 [Lachnospiraceae bacterium]|nr:hypothetical protein [Lachnospiraceae bacterium]
MKRPLEFTNGLVYNLLRKVIGRKFRLPSVRIQLKEIASTLGEWDAISFCYYDYLKKIEP